MAGLIVDGAETGSIDPWSSFGGRNFADNTTPPEGGPARPIRVRELATCEAAYHISGNAPEGQYVFQDGVCLCSWFIDNNGTVLLYRGDYWAGGTLIATSIFGRLPLDRYNYIRANVFLDSVAGTFDVYANGTLVASYVGNTVPAGQTYANRIGIAHNGFSVDASYPKHTMPDGRRGNYAFLCLPPGGNASFADDIYVSAPSILITGAGSIDAGDVITGPTGTITSSDFDTGATFQGVGVTGRIWGYNVTGHFSNGDAVTVTSGTGTFIGTAVVGTSIAGSPPWTKGCEPLSYGVDNAYGLPGVATADGAVQLTPVSGSGLANWQIAAQIPANSANYNENSTNVTQQDSYLANTNVLSTDTILAVCVYARAQLTDMNITTEFGTWTDSTGQNVGTPVDLPGSYNTLPSDVWTTRHDLTSITPADVSLGVMEIGVGLAP